MAWLILIVAGCCEVGWAIGLKYTEHFTRALPVLATISCMAASFGLLTLALRSLPVGTAYAVWTGIGAAGTAVLGMVVFGEPVTAARIVCLGLVVIGVFGLRIVS